MSKMGDLALDLEEQANEKGMTLQEALNAGYEVDYAKRQLVPSSSDEALEEYRKARLAEREEALNKLDKTIEQLRAFGYQWSLDRAEDLLEVEKFIIGESV